MADDGAARVFADAMSNRRELTASEFFANGWEGNAQERAVRGASDAEVRKLVREHMSANGGIHRISDLAGPKLKLAAHWLQGGDVAAVDGTDAISITDLATYSIYGAATGWVSRLVRGDSTISVTTTSSTYITPDAIRNSDDLISQMEDDHDRGRNSESWPRTFRENEERITALDRCPARCVLLDGPIVTQNLLSQAIGRATLTRLYDSDRIFIGFIKEIGGAMARTKWSGAALESGEVWVVGSIKDSLTGERRESLAKDIPTDYVRVVFRPNQKTFCLECRERDLEIALAITVVDRSSTLNHEIPLLLETIDAQLRSGFSGRQTSEMILHRIMREEGYGIGVNAMNERTFR